MPVMGEVLHNWNNAAAFIVGRVVYPVLIHLSKALVCSQSPEGDSSTGSSPHHKTAQQSA